MAMCCKSNDISLYDFRYAYLFLLAPVKLLAGKIISKMTCNVLRGTLNPTVPVPIPVCSNYTTC